MKYIIATAVVCLLIGAPLGSYFYLKSGFVYRLASLKDLEPKEMPGDIKALFKNTVPDNHKVRLVYLDQGSNDQADSQLLAIQDQIVDTTFFQTVRLDMRENTLAETDHMFYLLDTAGVLRRTYASNDQTLKDMIRHLSVVIPMPKRKEIKLNRDIDKPEGKG